jgi:uncharacterized membrane protein
MDDRMRDALYARLADASDREVNARQELETHCSQIDQVREALGNPYFYSGRAAGDPESKARYTGYASHEPAFRLFEQLNEVRREVAAIRDALRQAEPESE